MGPPVEREMILFPQLGGTTGVEGTVAKGSA